MHSENYPSRLLAEAVEQFSKLPGIGERSALRMALFLLRQKKEEALAFGTALNNLVEHVVFCKICHNLSDTEICSICSSKKRNKTILCIVENVRDVISIENTHQFNGLYHILGGIISPMEGIGPNDLEIESLIRRVHSEKINEVIFALSATMEGDTTNYYIYKKIKSYVDKISVIARGVSFGDELEYTDEITLGRSIVQRTLFENSSSQ
ncbi:MAG: recombination protein RecR [Bacteroidales bacterium]|nr:recombination protein RecR [Bacteroidales bacterium]